MGQEESQEKTEEATPRKLREARKKGQVPKSKDLSSVILLLIIFGAIAILKSSIGDHFKGFMIACFEKIGHISISQGDENLLLNLLQEAFHTATLILMPLLLITFFLAGLIGFLQVGSIFSIEPIKPSWKKINPIEGFKRIFKLRSFVELIKSALKISLVFLIAVFSIKQYLPDLIMSVTSGLIPLLMLTSKVLVSFIIKVGIFFLTIAIFDLMYQRWQHFKDMRMSKYEVTQEYKRDEGDPLIKQHRRQMHQELANTDISQVAKSDAVIVNPIHLAIAVQYDRTYMGSPQITVKGQRLVAEQILNVAKEHDVPIIENVPLAHALFKLDIGDEIPEELFEAMAEILSFVYRLRKKKEEETIIA